MFPATHTENAGTQAYDALPCETAAELDVFPGMGKELSEVLKTPFLQQVLWEAGGSPVDVFLVTASAQAFRGDSQIK